MSAPSQLHEQRVQTLEDLADLAGHTIGMAIYGGLRPDVSRLHHSTRSLLVADAKATETPDDPITRARLLRYALATRVWVDAGFQVALGVCHAPDPRGRWLESLASLMPTARHSVVRSTCATLDPDTSLTVLTVGECSQQRSFRMG